MNNYFRNLLREKHISLLVDKTFEILNIELKKYYVVFYIKTEDGRVGRYKSHSWVLLRQALAMLPKIKKGETIKVKLSISRTKTNTPCYMFV